MKKNTYRTIFGVMALAVIGAVYGLAQTQHQHEQDGKQTHRDMSKIDMSGMTNEPHHVLAMAYMQSIGTFAKVLSDQAQASGQLSADFARAVVTEMRRSLDQADEHHREHMKTMGEDMRTKMPAMIKEMDTRRSRLGNAVDALEKDVRDYTLNSKHIAADSDVVIKQLDEMTRMHKPMPIPSS
jgi:polyhydroxyalkanoate synthesis regulator phasin